MVLLSLFVEVGREGVGWVVEDEDEEGGVVVVGLEVLVRIEGRLRGAVGALTC